MKRAQIVLRVIVFILGIFSAVPNLGATEPPEVEANGSAIDEPFDPDAGVSLGLPLHLSENFNLGAVTESSAGEESASELNRQPRTRSLFAAALLAGAETI
jgi:hypothetical protein